MDARLRASLSARVAGLEQEALLRRMLCSVEQDPVWLGVANTMEAYATWGAFSILMNLLA
ncbi:hypothetical protein DF220_00190 [Salinibacterium hongtaonis]|uniref:Uncharacterized protein n=1 Tax=Homoserinimonas hongtaonis TaxID=2079791 RepID=A0A2U1SXV8_9MICO|nr:hypothetical protein DF220_00190 [Salinibacterium hongtaonis]